MASDRFKFAVEMLGRFAISVISGIAITYSIITMLEGQ